MDHKTLVLLDGDERYVFRFAEYLQKKVRLPLRVKAFTEEGELRFFLEDGAADILILPPELRDDETLKGRKATFWFSDEARPEDPSALFRYRPMEKNVRQILRALEGEGQETLPSGAGLKVWGVWSPAGGSGKTASALILGQLLGEEAPALYLNLERFSGLDTLLGGEKEGSLSDLLYLARVRTEGAFRLTELTEHLGNLAYIRPAAVGEDLRAAGEEDWTLLVETVRASRLFRHLVLDIGDGPADPLWLLSLCDRIYVPGRGDPAGGAKESEWRRSLEADDREDILGRIRRFTLPPPEEAGESADFRRLRYTNWGRQIRQLLLEEDR